MENLEIVNEKIQFVVKVRVHLLSIAATYDVIGLVHVSNAPRHDLTRD